MRYDSYINYEKLFQCPICQEIPVIKLLKVIGSKILIKLKCPNHKMRVIEVPLTDLDSYAHILYNNIFRCFTCGKPAFPFYMRISGAYAIIKCRCENTEHKSVTIKIWSTVFSKVITLLDVNLIRAWQELGELESGANIDSQILFTMENKLNGVKRSSENFEDFIKCPKCGILGIIVVLKMAGSRILIKYKCPKHRTRGKYISIFDIALYLNTIKSLLFRCYKCGNISTSNFLTFNGSYAMVDLTCKFRAHKQKTRKIWSTIYVDFIKEQEERTLQQNAIEQQRAPEEGEETLICKNCGAKLEENENFCHYCGSKVKK